MNSDRHDFEPGDVLGRYELLLPIAKGGMGRVWAARLNGTRGFQKLVALKTLLPSAVEAKRLEDMLFQEATLASLIKSPYVAETLDLGDQDGTLFLVMEWVEGESLEFIFRHATYGMPLAIAVQIIVQACKGLQAAHEVRDTEGKLLGLVHRDISPQNILVSYGGTAKVVDFGIAKATQSMTSTSVDGELKGKVAYMAPEHLRGEDIDARADIFAMGIVLYLLTTGHHPFKAETQTDTIRRICAKEPPRPPRSWIPDYPPKLEAVVTKALAKDPAARFASAYEMLQELEGALPQSLWGSSEREIADFLESMFQERMLERRRCIQRAIESLENSPARGERAVPFIRSSTLQGVALNTRSDHEPGKRVASSSPVTGTLARTLLRPGKASRRAWTVVGVTAAGAVAAAVTIGLTRSPNETRSRTFAASAASGAATGTGAVASSTPPKSAKPPSEPSGSSKPSLSEVATSEGAPSDGAPSAAALSEDAPSEGTRGAAASNANAQRTSSTPGGAIGRSASQARKAGRSQYRRPRVPERTRTKDPVKADLKDPY